MKLSKLVLCMLMSRQLVMFSIVHFNDCYDVQNANFFIARLEEERKAFFKKPTNYGKPEKNFQIAFSGDLIFPSVVSEVAEGRQFEMFLKKLGTTIAVIGNHEFDFGFDHFNDKIIKLAPNIKWLASNIHLLSDNSKKTIGKLGYTYIVTLENNLKLCYLGLIDDESFTSAKLPKDKYGMTNYLEKARELSKALKQNKECDVIIALTHMTTESDIALMYDEENAINFVLGGHTHDYIFKFNDDQSRFVLKSGVDFANFSVLECEESTCDPSKNQKAFENQYKSKLNENELTFTFCIPFTKKVKAKETVKYLKITMKKIAVSIDTDFIANFNQKVLQYTPVSEYNEITLKDYLDKTKNTKVKKIFEKLTSEKNLDLEFYINTFDHILSVPKYYKTLPSLYLENGLDISSEALITKENPLGNLITDIVRAKYDIDIAVINSSAISDNKTYNAGTLLNMLDMKKHFAERSIFNRADIEASDVVSIVKNGLLQNTNYPKRFLQISGLKVQYKSMKNDLADNSGNINRLKVSSIKPDRYKPANKTKFSLATLKVIAEPSQGFQSFKDIKLVKTYHHRNSFDLMEQFSQYGRTKEYCDELERFKKQFPNLSLDVLINISKQAAKIDKTKKYEDSWHPTVDELKTFKSDFKLPNDWESRKPKDHTDTSLGIPTSFMIYLDQETFFKMKAFTLVESTCYHDASKGDEGWAFRWKPTTSQRIVCTSDAASEITGIESDIELIQELIGEVQSERMIL